MAGRFIIESNVSKDRLILDLDVRDPISGHSARLTLEDEGSGPGRTGSMKLGSQQLLQLIQAATAMMVEIDGDKGCSFCVS